MRPDGLFGVLTTTMRVRGVMAAAMASRSRSKARLERRDLDRHEPGLEGERLVEEPRRQGVDDLLAGVGEHLHRDRDRAEATGRHADVVGAPAEGTTRSSEAAAAAWAATSLCL